MRVILAGCEGSGILEASSVEIVDLCSTCALIVLVSTQVANSGLVHSELHCLSFLLTIGHLSRWISK